MYLGLQLFFTETRYCVRLQSSNSPRRCCHFANSSALRPVSLCDHFTSTNLPTIVKNSLTMSKVWTGTWGYGNCATKCEQSMINSYVQEMNPVDFTGSVTNYSNLNVALVLTWWLFQIIVPTGPLCYDDSYHNKL